MFPFHLLLVPALMLQAPEAPGPAIVDLGHGLHILKGAPTAGTFAEIKRLHITQVIDLRTDGELSPANESAILSEAGTTYMRYAISRTPPADDFKFIREILTGLRGARVLIHCNDGNRAAAAACPWLVLDKGMRPEEALKLCREAGLQRPETEEAVRRYLASQAKS